MPTIFFANTVSPEECAENKENIERLISGTTLPGDNVEKLNGSRAIYSMRINKKGRIIFTFFEYKGHRHPIILEIDANHKYNTKFLDEGVYRAYFEKHQHEFAAIIDQPPVSQEGQASAAAKYVPVQIIHNKVHILDDAQRAIHAPAIVEGGPGTGKTCVAYKLIEDNAAEGKRVLYITQSERLAEHIQECWKQSPHYAKNKDNVQILTYDQVIAQFEPGVVLNAGAFGFFCEWFKKQADYKSDQNEVIFQELRTRSGFQDAEGYFQAGHKDTFFKNTNEREWLDNLYQRWMLAARSYPEFHSYTLPQGDERAFDMVVCDEAQDLSGGQLRTVESLAKDHNIVFLIDPRQSLTDDHSRSTFLQQLFYEKGISLQISPLKTAYRTAPNVMRLASAVNDLRIAMTPAKKRQSPIQYDDTDSGEVILLDHKNVETENDIERLMKSKDACIITTAERKGELIQKGFSQVFTVDEIKGLEFKIVIIIDLLTDEIYKEINDNMQDDGRVKEGSQAEIYSSPLSRLFTAITRAIDSVYIYQNNPHPVSRIVNLLRQHATGMRGKKTIIETPKAGWLAQAKDLYGNYYQTAMLILTKNLEMTEENARILIQAWKDEKNPRPSPAAVPAGESSKTRQPVKDRVLPRFNTQKSLNDYLDKACTTGDLSALRNLLDYRESRKLTLNWEHRTKDGRSALDIVCDADESDETIKMVEKLVQKGVQLNTTSGIGIESTFRRLILNKKYHMAAHFLSSDHFYLEMEYSKDADDAFNDKLYQLYCQPSLPQRGKITDYFRQHSPAHLYKSALHLFRLGRTLDSVDMEAEAVTLFKHGSDLDDANSQLFLATILTKRFDQEEDFIIKVTLLQRASKLLKKAGRTLPNIQVQIKSLETSLHEFITKTLDITFRAPTRVQTLLEMLKSKKLSTADLNYQTQDGLSALSIACESPFSKDNQLLASILIWEFKVDLNGMTQDGKTTLFQSLVLRSAFDMMNIFLKCELFSLKMHYMFTREFLDNILCLCIHSHESSPQISEYLGILDTDFAIARANEYRASGELTQFSILLEEKALRKDIRAIAVLLEYHTKAIHSTMPMQVAIRHLSKARTALALYSEITDHTAQACAISFDVLDSIIHNFLGLNSKDDISMAKLMNILYKDLDIRTIHDLLVEDCLGIVKELDWNFREPNYRATFLMKIVKISPNSTDSFYIPSLAQHLIVTQDVDINVRDEHQNTAFVYAALVNPGNNFLIDLFLSDKFDMDVNYTQLPDNKKACIDKNLASNDQWKEMKKRKLTGTAPKPQGKRLTAS